MCAAVMGEVVIMAAEDKHVLKCMPLEELVVLSMGVHDDGCEDTVQSHILAPVHAVVDRGSSLLYISCQHQLSSCRY